MSYTYDKSGQRLFFQREGSTYGKPYDPETDLTAFTAIDADYPHWRRFDLIEDTFDVVIPFIEKIKKFDISDSKHASAILSGNIKPQDLTLSMSAQALEFLPLAVGAPSVTSHKQAMIQDIKFPAKASINDQGYFFFDIINGSANVEHHVCWFDTNTAGSAPTITGINASNVHEVAIDTDTYSYEVADAVATVINAISGVGAIHSITDTDISFTAATSTIGRAGGDNDLSLLKAGDTIVISGSNSNDGTYTMKTVSASAIVVNESLTNESASASVTIECERVKITNDNAGAVQMAFESSGTPSGLTEVRVNTWGSTDYAISEALTTDIPSFTIHMEQRNTTSDEDIVYDLFGCVVDSIKVELTGADGVATYDVTFKCPYAVEGNRSTNNPPRKYIQGFPTMSSLQESAGHYLIQEVATDKTPQTVDSIILSIVNNVEMKGDISKRYATKAFATRRDISLQIIGTTTERALFDYYLEAFDVDGIDWFPSAASGKLNGDFKIQRDATYDYIMMHFYNFMCEEHNFQFVSVDDAVKSVDMTFTDGSADTNGRIIDDFDYVSYIDKTIMVV